MRTETLDKRYYLFKQIDMILLFLLILSYAYFFVYIIPWIDILGKDFSDIRNYMERIEYLNQGLPEREFHGISILFSEYLWKYISIAIGRFFNDYRAGLYLVSFISISLYSFFTFRRVNIILVSLLLITPMFIDLVMGQLRMSIAFPLLLVGYELRGKTISLIPILTAIFIHSASFIFITVYFILKYIERECHLDDQKKTFRHWHHSNCHIRGVQNAIREILSVLLIHVSDLLKPGHNDRPLKIGPKMGLKNRLWRLLVFARNAKITRKRLESIEETFSYLLKKIDRKNLFSKRS